LEHLLFYSPSAGAGLGFLPIKLFGMATNTTKMAMMPMFLINPNVQLPPRSPRADRLVHLWLSTRRG
jgi:hypothetical protein